MLACQTRHRVLPVHAQVNSCWHIRLLDNLFLFPWSSSLGQICLYSGLIFRIFLGPAARRFSTDIDWGASFALNFLSCLCFGFCLSRLCDLGSWLALICFRCFTSASCWIGQCTWLSSQFLDCHSFGRFACFTLSRRLVTAGCSIITTFNMSCEYISTHVLLFQVINHAIVIDIRICRVVYQIVAFLL